MRCVGGCVGGRWSVGGCLGRCLGPCAPALAASPPNEAATRPQPTRASASASLQLPCCSCCAAPASCTALHRADRLTSRASVDFAFRSTFALLKPAPGGVQPHVRLLFARYPSSTTKPEPMLSKVKQRLLLVAVAFLLPAAGLVAFCLAGPRRWPAAAAAASASTTTTPCARSRRLAQEALVSPYRSAAVSVPECRHQWLGGRGQRRERVRACCPWWRCSPPGRCCSCGRLRGCCRGPGSRRWCRRTSPRHWPSPTCASPVGRRC